MKKLSFTFFVFVFFICLCACSVQNNSLKDTASPSSVSQTETSLSQGYTPENIDKDNYIYVALGDSICEGYGLENKEIEAFPSLLKNKLGNKWTLYNYGVSGQTGIELKEFIESGNASMLTDADLITISIGANNIISRVLDSISITSFSPSFIYSILEEEFTEIINEGVTELKSDIPDIISSIKKINDRAQIVFLTIYNPYAAFTYEYEYQGNKNSLASFTDEIVLSLNKVINENSSIYKYKIADIYTSFKNSGSKLINASPFNFIFDPHPNKEGHEVISEEIHTILQQNA